MRHGADQVSKRARLASSRLTASKKSSLTPKPHHGQSAGGTEAHRGSRQRTVPGDLDNTKLVTAADSDGFGEHTAWAALLDHPPAGTSESDGDCSIASRGLAPGGLAVDRTSGLVIRTIDSVESLPSCQRVRHGVYRNAILILMLSLTCIVTPS